MIREITIISSKNMQINRVNTDAATWGELVSEIESSYDLENLKAVENIRKTTLEHPDAVLPEGPFRIFLRQSKAKHGADVLGELTFAQLRERYIFSDYARTTSRPFIVARAESLGKNWTQLGYSELLSVIREFVESLSPIAPSSSVNLGLAAARNLREIWGEMARLAEESETEEDNGREIRDEEIESFSDVLEEQENSPAQAWDYFFNRLDSAIDSLMELKHMRGSISAMNAGVNSEEYDSIQSELEDINSAFND